MAPKLFWSATLATLLLTATAAAVPPQLGQLAQLGTPVDDTQLAAVSITVYPDGRGLPAGSGNAITGKQVFEHHCRACHGSNGRDGINDSLSGGQGTLASPAPTRTIGSYWPYATSVFDYVRRAMPYNSPGSLSADELYAVTAYLLAENGVITTDQKMNAQSLTAVNMPNRNGFNWLTGDDQ